MQPAQHVALADHLQIVHDHVVAFRRRLMRALPERGGVRAGGQNGKPMIGGHLRHGLAQITQFRTRLTDIGMGKRRSFDLRLQEFALDLSGGGRLGGGEERLRHLACDRLGLCVD